MATVKKKCACCPTMGSVKKKGVYSVVICVSLIAVTLKGHSSLAVDSIFL